MAASEGHAGWAEGRELCQLVFESHLDQLSSPSSMFESLALWPFRWIAETLGTTELQDLIATRTNFTPQNNDKCHFLACLKRQLSF